ncbi:hypothetical protein ACP275_02G029700 [Erythranthe tilingii]
MMIIQRLEMCLGLLKLVMEFVMVFFDAVGCVINQSHSLLSDNPSYAVNLPYIGLFP